MAYTPINWAENLDVDATKLDKMDNQIDANEQRLTDIDNKATGTVTDNLQGQIDTNENDLRAIEDGTTGVGKLASGLTNVEFYANGGTLINNSSTVVNLPFIADYVLIATQGGSIRIDGVTDKMFVVNANSFTLVNSSDTEDMSYSYMAVKRN